jgi:hypothetical protein
MYLMFVVLGLYADTADRFINSKCVKYMLRAGDIKTAEETASMFTRESSNPIAQLSEMQCIWFETETAKAQVQALNAGMALKKLHTIGSHYDTMVEDQFDFHTCALRRIRISGRMLVYPIVYALMTLIASLHHHFTIVVCLSLRCV